MRVENGFVAARHLKKRPPTPKLLAYVEQLQLAGRPVPEQYQWVLPFTRAIGEAQAARASATEGEAEAPLDAREWVAWTGKDAAENRRLFPEFAALREELSAAFGQVDVLSIMVKESFRAKHARPAPADAAGARSPRDR
jgi:hypothetical protein